MWKRIGVCADLNCYERLWHAGLSGDGSKCFVAGFDNENYIIWDIKNEEVIWEDKNRSKPSLEKWVDKDGFVMLQDENVKGRYRIFGLNINNPKTFDEKAKLRLKKGSGNRFNLINIQSEELVAELEFEEFSGDWAFASFSENGKVIAVIEPYNITFFGIE